MTDGRTEGGDGGGSAGLLSVFSGATRAKGVQPLGVSALRLALAANRTCSGASGYRALCVFAAALVVGITGAAIRAPASRETERQPLVSQGRPVRVSAEAHHHRARREYTDGADPSEDGLIARAVAALAIPTLLARAPMSDLAGWVHDPQNAPPDILGRDVMGTPEAWAHSAGDGSFPIRVPASMVQWSATRGLTSPRYTAQGGEDSRPVELESAPKGGVRLMVRDVDTGQTLTARLIVRRLDPPANASFTTIVPTERQAAPAVQILDALQGDATATLPNGGYRVIATKGIEWSVDARELHVVAGQANMVELFLRHVVPTPGVVNCDLHTHARPSFDSHNSPEDTVLSLVAAGISFSVSTSHNIVSDYRGAAVALGLDREFSSIPGVEVTTYNPRFGHFGLFPSTTAPRFEHSNLQSLIREVRVNRNSYFQVNHPRLPGGIGYFETIALDPHRVRARLHERPDFDGIEVYNGFDIEQPARVDEVLRDYWALLDQGWRYTATGGSDSHCLQYHCAVRVLGHLLESSAGVGYPRTMVAVEPHAGREDERLNLDPAAIVENLKCGHATVTSGPVIELVLEGVGPGDELFTSTDVVRGHLRVRAAPWIDVSQVEIVAGQNGIGWQTVASYGVEGRPSQWGPGTGTLEEALANAVRLERDIAVRVGLTDGWVQAIVRGTRRMSDVLPDVEVAPLAFTNPIYVRHQASGVP